MNWIKVAVTIFVFLILYTKNRYNNERIQKAESVQDKDTIRDIRFIENFVLAFILCTLTLLTIVQWR